MIKRSTTVKVIGGICVIGVVGGLSIGQRVKGQIHQAGHADHMVNEEQLKIMNKVEVVLEDDEEESIYTYVESLIEEYNGDSLAIIEMNRQYIEHDANERYMVKMQVIGSDAYTGVGVYDYYVILSKQGEHYQVLPLGIEVIKDSQNTIKRDLILSMLKTANGWGLTAEQNEARYDVLLEEAGHEAVQDLSNQQKIIKFIHYTIQDCIYQLNKKQEDVQIELASLEILDIVNTVHSDSIRAHVGGQLILCTNTAIESAEVNIRIDMIEELDGFKIVDTHMEINKGTKK